MLVDIPLRAGARRETKSGLLTISITAATELVSFICLCNYRLTLFIFM